MPPIPTSSAIIAKANRIAREFALSAEQVQDGVVEFLRLMELGLEKDGEDMAMIPTYVTTVPKGNEKGVYLAADLGGTNFRVCSITLRGDSTYTLTQSKTAIPRSLMAAPSTSKDLFSHLATQIASFCEEHHSECFSEDPEHHLRLGFTFSFPVDQQAINKGYLIRWTKGFDLKDAIGKDICELLQKELDLLGVPVRVAALVNDTVGTLMSRSYTSPGKTGTLLGAIFGTGTNGAYIEQLDNVKKMFNGSAKDAYGEFDSSSGLMVVNTEWGGFDNKLRTLPDSPYDQALDKLSPNPGMQMFEKRVSGMFLGELLRHAIQALRDEVGLFGGESIQILKGSNLYVPWSIDTSFLSIVEADTSDGLAISRQLIEAELGISNASSEDAEAIRIVSRAIGKRSARLSAIPLAAIVIRSSFSESQVEELKEDEGVGLDSEDSDEGLGFSSAPQPVSQTVHSTSESVAEKAPPVGDSPPSTIISPGNGASSVRPPTSSGPTTVSGSADYDESHIIDVGVDGSLVEFYPGFEKYLREALRDIKELGEKGEKRIRIGQAKDGSGVGAALIALVAK